MSNYMKDGNCFCVWRRQWHPTPVLLPGKSHGWRSLEGCSPRGRWGSDTTEQLHFLFSLSCNGEGNGNPLQCSCLENPRDGGAWWAAVYGVTQSWTRLKRLSSSSSSTLCHENAEVVKLKKQNFYLGLYCWTRNTFKQNKAYYELHMCQALESRLWEKMLMMMMMTINKALCIAHPLNPYKDSE